MFIWMISAVTGGVLYISLGLHVWRKQEITRIPNRHYKNVNKYDIKSYTEGIGKAFCIIGLGLILIALLSYIYRDSWVGLLPSAFFFFIGVTVFVRTQKKYNGSIF